MIQKRAAILTVCAVLLFCIVAAGCTTNQTPTLTPTLTPTPSPTLTPTPTSTPTSTLGSLSVLFFRKPDCPYCTALENTTSFQQLQKKASVQWVVSNQSSLTGQYEVTEVPTLILLNNGTEVARWTNPSDASAINAKIDSLLAGGSTPTPTSTSASLSVLFFYKPDCPYCTALENTASFQQLQKKASVQSIVSDESPLTGQYGVSTVPTLILLNHGTEVARWTNPADASAINAQIDSLAAG